MGGSVGTTGSIAFERKVLLYETNVTTDNDGCMYVCPLNRYDRVRYDLTMCPSSLFPRMRQSAHSLIKNWKGGLSCRAPAQSQGLPACLPTQCRRKHDEIKETHTQLPFAMDGKTGD